MVDQHSGNFLLGKGFGQEPGDGQVLEARQVAGVDGGDEHEDHALPLGRGQLLVGFEERKPVHDGHIEVKEDEGRATGRGRLAVGVQPGEGRPAIQCREHLNGRGEVLEQLGGEKVAGRWGR